MHGSCSLNEAKPQIGTVSHENHSPPMFESVISQSHRDKNPSGENKASCSGFVNIPRPLLCRIPGHVRPFKALCHMFPATENAAVGALGSVRKAPPTTYGVSKDELSPVEAPAVVIMDIALRDRDYARLRGAQAGENTPTPSCALCRFGATEADANAELLSPGMRHAAPPKRVSDICDEVSVQDASRAGVLCVGDKAMLRVEEPISYPINEARPGARLPKTVLCCWKRRASIELSSILCWWGSARAQLDRWNSVVAASPVSPLAARAVSAPGSGNGSLVRFLYTKRNGHWP